MPRLPYQRASVRGADFVLSTAPLPNSYSYSATDDSRVLHSTARKNSRVHQTSRARAVTVYTRLV